MTSMKGSVHIFQGSFYYIIYWASESDMVEIIYSSWSKSIVLQLALLKANPDLIPGTPESPVSDS